jgi:hypothetical protein
VPIADIHENPRPLNRKTVSRRFLSGITDRDRDGVADRGSRR